MPDLDVYAFPSFREVIQAVYAIGGPMAVNQEELAASSGFSGAHLSNSRGRTRRLSFDYGVRLGRSFWLDMDSARFFATRVRQTTAATEEQASIREELAALEAAHRRAVAEGRLFARAPSLPPPLEGLALIVPPMFYKTSLKHDPTALAAAFRPQMSVARAERVLSLARPWLDAPPQALRVAAPDEPAGRLAHVAAIRRLYHSLFNITVPESRTRLSVWAVSKDDLQVVRYLVTERLRRLVDRLTEDSGDAGPRVVLQLVGRMFLVTEAPGGDRAPRPPPTRQELARIVSKSDSPPGPRLMAYEEMPTYLQQRFTFRKQENPNRTYASFGRRVTLSATAVRQIVAGDRHLSAKLAVRFGRNLEHKGEELTYFKLMAELDRTDCPVRQTAIRAEMAAIRMRHGLVSVEKDGLVFYARWYYSVIREMAFREDFRADPAWVASQLRPRITPEEAKEALMALLDLGILVRDDAGVPRPSGTVVSLPDAIRGATDTYLFQYTADLAEHALLTCPPEELFMDGYCLSLPVVRVQEAMDGLVEILHAADAWLRERPVKTSSDQVGMLFMDATPLTWELPPK